MNICPLILNLSILKSWPVSDEVSDEVIKCMCLQFDQSDSSMFWRHTEARLAPVFPLQVYRDSWPANVYSSTIVPSIVCAPTILTKTM